AYNHLFFRTLRTQGVIPGVDVLRVLFLHHVDAQWRGGLSDLSQACRAPGKMRAPSQGTERRAGIPDRLQNVPQGDRQLLVTAANKVVEQSRQEIEDFVAGKPSAERTAQ